MKSKDTSELWQKSNWNAYFRSAVVPKHVSWFHLNNWQRVPWALWTKQTLSWCTGGAAIPLDSQPGYWDIENWILLSTFVSLNMTILLHSSWLLSCTSRSVVTGKASQTRSVGQNKLSLFFNTSKPSSQPMQYQSTSIRTRDSCQPH